MKPSANLCETYLRAAQTDRSYYTIFFEMCRKFHIDWATASEKEKDFVTEVTRVTYERTCSLRAGTSPDAVRPAVSA